MTYVLHKLLLIIAISCCCSYGYLQSSSKFKTANPLSPLFKRRQQRDSALLSTKTSPEIASSLTQKDYLVAVRNRLYAVDEMIWLHDYAKERPSSPIKQLSEAKYSELVQARADLLDEYPLATLYSDLKDAQQKNLTYAAIHIDRIINSFSRQLPMPLVHTNQIAVLSFSGQVINLMRGQGALSHRLLPSNILTEREVKRQFQHPAFSSTGKNIAFVEMHFKETTIVRSDVLVFDVPSSPKAYGSSDNMPSFDSGELPGTPFFLRFSPDDETLIMLCTSSGNSTSEPTTSLVAMDWAKYSRKDLQGQKIAASPRKFRSLMQGSPVFLTYTTSNAKNATIVAHCQKEVEDAASKSLVMEKAVWMLQRQDTGGVNDYKWKKLSDSDPKQRWSTPVCHSAGGGDSVLVVEDGWLVTKALSRWKRDAAGAQHSKQLMRVKGQVQFLVSPDGSKAVVLQEDINAGHYSLTVIEGEAALDPSAAGLGRQYELPTSRLAVAFWFSPDSSKVLLLSPAGKSKEDVASQKSGLKIALTSEMTWTVFSFLSQEVVEYEQFKPTPYFMKSYVPFFSQYAQVYNPWAPDSKSFIYLTAAGLNHVPLVGSRHCLGEDLWSNQGATFATWSKN